MSLKQNLGILRFQKNEIIFQQKIELFFSKKWNYFSAKNGIIFQQKNHTSVDLLVFEYEYLIHLILS